MTKTKKRTGLLPNIEVLIIAVFFISFVIFMVPKCESAKDDYETEVLPTDTDTILVETQIIVPEQTAPAPVTTVISGQLSLYVTIDGINLRREPNVASNIIRKLNLYEEVYYKNETTEKTKEIDWGNGVVTNEPWVKIETQDGKVGWLYGAGLHFYRRKFNVPENEGAGVQ